MRIDLGEKIAFEVIYNGQTYDLSEPTVKQVRSYQEDVKAEGADEFEELLKFLHGLGMPKEVCEDLGVNKLKTLVDKLVGGIEAKK